MSKIQLEASTTTTTKDLNFSDFEIQMLILERNACQGKVEAIDELLNKIGATQGFRDADEKSKKPPAAAPPKATVQELAFTALNWERQEGGRIGNYEIATKAKNDSAKWTAAHEILTEAKATIQTRYLGKDYQFSYWLYDSTFAQEKIYRQKLKQ